MADDAGRAAPPEGGPEYLVVGHMTKPHGTKGEVFIWPLTDHPDEVFAVGRRLAVGDDEGRLAEDAPARELVIERVRPFKRGRLVKFEGFEDRTAVEPFAQRYVLVRFDELPERGEGEVFYHELLGLEVRTVDGEVVGRVREVYETEPADLLEVTGERGVHLIPFSERIVRKVDLSAGRLEIDPPPGLLDL